MQNQNGFTLVELVVVIVILGILGAVAVPRFINMRADAQQAAVEGIAGALGSASAINYAARNLNVVNGVAITDCDEVENALEGGLDTDYTVTSAAIAAGTTVSCTVTGPGPVTDTFIGHGIL